MFWPTVTSCTSVSMYKSLYFFAALLLCGCQFSSPEPAENENETEFVFSAADRAEMELIMSAQERAWNAGDLEAFMLPYWQSDSLLFVGSSGANYGWANTLVNYQRSYPSPAHMGQLQFEVLQLDALGAEHAFMLGSWHLQRSDSLGDLQGHFTLIWARSNAGNNWHIISDHSS